MKVEVPINKLPKSEMGIEVTVVGKPSRMVRFRIWLAVRLIMLASWIVNAQPDVKVEENHEQH